MMGLSWLRRACGLAPLTERERLREELQAGAEARRAAVEGVPYRPRVVTPCESHQPTRSEARSCLRAWTAYARKIEAAREVG